MGLDVMAYNKLNWIDADTVDKDSDGYPRNDDTIWFGDFSGQNEIWPGRAEPLDSFGDEAYYKYDTSDHLSAGSYSTYNGWRALLQEFVEDNDDVAYDAFEELIDFSDCDGVIGSIVSQKLYDDFVAYRDAIDEYAFQVFGNDKDESDWFLYQYDGWCRLFDLARDDGCIVLC